MPGSRFVPLLLVATFLAGCKVGPNFHPPVTSAPPDWQDGQREAATQPAVTTQEPQLALWWQTLGDPVLADLVDQALSANLDLAQAEARLRQARAQRGVVVGGLFPSVSDTASYDRVKVPARPSQNLFQNNLDAAWELDIFGGIRRNVESADASVLAATETLRDVQVSVAAEVAIDYIQLRGFQEQIAIARENLAAQQHTADIVGQRREAGFVSALDVANAEAQVATTSSTIPPLETSARQTIYALSILLARQPGELVEELSAPGPIPVTPPEVPVGLPSELLRRRPDIRAAEANLHAATAQIGVATAQLFPSFSLNGSMSWQSGKLADWFNESSRAWSVGPQANWSIFQGGSIVSNIHVQEALRDQAFISYRQTVLTAFQDVENALVALTQEQLHNQALVAAVAYNRQAVDLSMKLYTEGNTDFLNVLNAQRSLFVVEDALVLSHRNLATDLVSLYKALGGGWENLPLTGPPPASAPAPAGL
jgi:outer membrane protein, multidrug efflux system